MIKRKTLVETAFFLVIVALGALFVIHAWIKSENEQSENVLRLARSLETILPKAELKMLEALPGDTGKPQYLFVKKTLQKIIRINPNARFAYIYVERNGKIFFCADSEPEGSKDCSPPGQEYTEAASDYMRPITQGHEIITNPVSDRWGRWISVLIPIKDEASGKTIAVFGMDFNAKSWNATMFTELSESAAIVAILLLALIFTIRIIYKNRALKREMTSRRQAEALVQQTRHNHETFFNTINDFLFILDEQGNIIHANSTVYKRLGYSPEELAGISVLMVHPSERRDEAARIVGEMLAGTTEFCPVPIETKSGVHIPVETRVSQGFWDGKPVLFGVTKDISQIKLSEEKFSKLFHLNPSACGLTDLNSHKYIEVNDAFSVLLGFDKNEVVGKTATELGILTPETMRAIFFAADSKGHVTNASATLKAKDGDIRHVLLSSENIHVQDKKYRFTVVHDVTRLMEAEDELKQAYARLSLAARAGGVGVWDLDLVNNILVWDDQMFKLYGTDKRDFIGAYEAWLAGVHPDDVARGDAEIQMAVSGEKEFDTEFRVCWSDGSVHFIRALAIVQRDGSGAPLKMIGTNWDITAWKNAEETLRQTGESLKEMNVQKDKLFSIIAHDLRGPFNGFLGLSKMLAEELPDLTQAEIQKMASSMKNSATNLYRLLENLLEWSRSQRGMIKFEPGPFLLMPMVVESMHPVMNSFMVKEIELRYEIPANLTVFADEHMLASTIRNLASNAMKFTHRGGKVTISATMVSGNFVEITVKDTGIGMSSEMVDGLFRPDVKTNRKGSEGEPSSGLGLILCKDFIEKHGGRIWAESKEGIGSAFRVTLPVQNQ